LSEVESLKNGEAKEKGEEGNKKMGTRRVENEQNKDKT